MKTISVHLQKGGVGKTSISGNIAYLLSKKGRTVLVDADPQGNSSSWYNKDLFDPKYELADVLLGKCELKEALHKVRDNLWLVPTFGLDGDLKMYAETQLSNEPFIFEDVTEALKQLGFEYVVFDLSPGIGRLEKAVLLASSEILVPMLADSFSLDGLEIFSNELTKLGKAYRRTISHNKLIVNAIDQRKLLHGEIVSLIPAHLNTYQIPTDPAFSKAQASGKAIFELLHTEAPKKATVQALEALARDL